MGSYTELVNVYVFGAPKECDTLNIIQGFLFLIYLVIIFNTKGYLRKINENFVSIETFFKEYMKLIIKLCVFGLVYAEVALINRYRSDFLEPADGLAIVLFSMALGLFNLVYYLILKIIAQRKR